MALAREFGLPSWSALEREIEARSASMPADMMQFLRFSVNSNIGRAARMLAEDETLAESGFPAAIVLGNADRVEAELRRDPGAATRVDKATGWSALHLACASRFHVDLARAAGLLHVLANPQATGAGGGHDLHYRTLQDLGVVLVGRLAGCADHRVGFVDDLAASVAFGDARWADARSALANGLPELGYPVPELPVPAPFRYTPVTEVDLRGFGAVIFTTGYRPGYRWIDFPILDELGYPITVDGASPVVGLYFCGVHFMRLRRSGFLFGVGEDAAIVATSIATLNRMPTATRRQLSR